MAGGYLPDEPCGSTSTSTTSRRGGADADARACASRVPAEGNCGPANFGGSKIFALIRQRVLKARRIDGVVYSCERTG